MENTNRNSYTTSPFVSENNPDFLSQYINIYTHKGIFHPEPNIFICKAHCCCKYLGLFIILYGSIFAIVFPLTGILCNIFAFIIVGPSILLGCLIAAIIIFNTVTIEVKFTFSHPMVEIISSSMCKKKRLFVEKMEISEIFFEYTETNKKGIYQALHIKFNNGNENTYFKIKSNPPCFTKYEVNYFNNEMKKLLSSNYNSY